MDHHKIFYTNLFVIDDFVSIETKEKNQSHAEVSKKIIADMKKYISDLWTKREYDNNWQTKSANLHKQKEFKSFVDLVMATSHSILKQLDYKVDDIIITDMWANVLREGENHQAHTHSNNFLSGTYYLHSDKGAGITFHDPRPAADVLVPRKKEVTLDNASLLTYASKQNRAIIFPSWLPHWVQQNKSKTNRISIAWNIQVKGQVGEHHEFQSATI